MMLRPELMEDHGSGRSYQASQQYHSGLHGTEEYSSERHMNRLMRVNGFWSIQCLMVDTGTNGKGTSTFSNNIKLEHPCMG